MTWDDKTVLKVGSLAVAGLGLSSWIIPEQHQNFFYEALTARSNVATQWFGMGLCSCAACSLTVALSKEHAPKTVKNLLKTSGVLFAIAAAQNLYNVENGWQKKEPGYVLAAVHVFLAAVALWRGYSQVHLRRE